jgi:hypothetical protein
MGKPRRDMVHKRDGIRPYAVSTHDFRRRGKREQYEGVIVEVAREVDWLVVEIETPGEASVGKPRRPPQEIKSKRNRFLGARYVVSCSCGKHIGLARGNAQAPKRGRALQRGGIEVFVEGAALPIHPMFEPKWPRLVDEPA